MYNNNNTHISVPGKKGAIARLIVMAITVLIGAFASVSSLFHSSRDLGGLILEAIGGFGEICLIGVWFWIMMKWIGFMAPKSFAVANSFWCSWHALTIFGLYIKSAIWLMITIIPVSIGGFTFVPLFQLAFALAKNGVNFFGAMGMLALGVGSVVLVGFLDVCKLRQLSAWEELKRLLAERKAVRA